MSNSNLLRQWMDCTNVSSSCEEWNSKAAEQQSEILILDGGVSTHLEFLIRQQQEEQQRNENRKDANASSRQQQRCCCQSSSNSSSNDVFKYRSLWSSSLLLEPNGRNLIRKSHEIFYDSGCDLISTVTYQLSHLICQSSSTEHKDGKSHLTLLSKYDNDDNSMSRTPKLLVDDVDKLLKLGIQLAHEARMSKMKRPLYVIGSLGCYGAALADGSEYRGDYKIGLGELIQFHRRRFQVMMDYWIDPIVQSTDTDNCENCEFKKERNNVNYEGIKANDHQQTELLRHGNVQIDGIAFETVPNILEVEAIINVIKERMNQNYGHDKNVAIWISLACKNEKHLNDGSNLIDVLDMIEKLDIDGFIHGIGVNCFNVKYATSLTKILASHQVNSKFQRAIIFYPNSGEDWDDDNGAWIEGSGCTNDDFADHVIDAIQSIHTIYRSKRKRSRTIVGGCCRTSPSTINSIRQKIDQMI